MLKIDPTTWRAARYALDKAVALYLDDPNVSLIDLGFRAQASSQSCRENELVVRIHVRQKSAGEFFHHFAANDSDCVIDTQRIGFAFEALEAEYNLHLLSEARRREKQRGRAEYQISGGKVRDRQSGEEMILTSWHALLRSHFAGKNFPTGWFAQAGEYSEDSVASESWRSVMHAGLDAAVIKTHLPHQKHDIGDVTGVMVPQLGQRVIKFGARTGVKSGIVTGVLGYMMQRETGIPKIVGPVVQITPQTPDEQICAPGDSGSWWLESATRRAVALHFAGSDNPNSALALSMPEVLAALDVQIVTESAPFAAVRSISPPNVSKTSEANEAWWRALTASAFKGTSMAFKFLTAVLTKRLFFCLMQAGLLLGIGAATIGFRAHLKKIHHRHVHQITQLQKEFEYAKTIARVDSARQQQMRRIVGIIDRFNPEMNSELKFSLAAEIYAMSLKYSQLDIDLICATITHETGRTWNPEAISFAGALGLMQILPSTGIGLAQEEGLVWTSTEEILFNPIYNVRLGCRYLAQVITDYGLEAGLAAYNGGGRQAKRWLQGGSSNSQLHPETALYVPAILKIYREYRHLNL